MSDKEQKKKAWKTPVIRRLEVTDELLELFASHSPEKREIPGKRFK